jgi:hypothetical protein
MLTALILVCSLATVSNECTRDNALDVVYVPAMFASSVACLMHAQAYAAGSSIGRDLPQNEAIKVICVRDPINKVKPRAVQAGRTNLSGPSGGCSPLTRWFAAGLARSAAYYSRWAAHASRTGFALSSLQSACSHRWNRTPPKPPAIAELFARCQVLR